MVANAPADTARALSRVWQRWTCVVAQCAAGKRPGMTPKQYAQLHRELIEASRLAGVAAAPADRDFYEQLKTLARPWMTLSTLTQTDAAIVNHLLGNCQEAAERLCGGKVKVHQDGMMSATTIAVVILLLVLSIVAVSLDWWPRSLPERLQALAGRGWRSWQDLGATYQASIVAVVVAPFILVLLSRVMRR